MLLSEVDHLRDFFSGCVLKNAGGRINSMAELQERARTVATQCGAEADHPLLQLVDDLCQEGDRIVDDAKKEHMDLLQQVGWF